MHLNSKYFCLLDISSSYYAIALRPKARRFFCFYDPDGKLNHLNRIPMGFIDSSVHLARVLDQVLPERANLVIFQDDILIFSETSLDHCMTTLLEVLRRLSNSGMKISPRKARLFHEEIVFLGNLLGRGKICIPQEKVKCFTDVPYPTKIGRAHV